MREGAKRASPYVKSADLLPPPPLGRALLFAGIAAGLGTAAWGLLAFYTNREFGILACGIGLLIGLAIVRGGGHGTFLAFCGGALALLSIVSGKHMAFRMRVDQFVVSHDSRTHAERTRDATDWVALGPSPTTEQVQAFIDDHGYDVDDPAAFAREEGQRLRAFAEARPTAEEWRDQQKAAVVEQITFLDVLLKNTHPLAFMFALIGIATAFGVVSKATATMRVAARQALREQREAVESGEGSAS
jgi:hypothetical protein